MAAEFKVSIGADIAGLNSGLNSAENRISSFVSKVNKVGELGDVFQNIGAKLTAGLTLPIIGLGAASIKSFGEIQSLQKGLEAVMGSASAAGSEFEKLKEVAKLPGLGLNEAVKGSINLQSIGIDAEKSRNILLQFGNAVATVGKGRAEFERAIYGVQQLANTDFPLGEDLNIIKDALPQVSNLLKEAFGTARSEELQKLGITSQQVLGVITGGLEKLPRVSGGVKGAFENLSDSINVSLGKVGQIIDKNLNITGLLEKVSNGISSLVDWFSELSPSVQTGILAFAGLAAALGPVLLAVGAFMSMLPQLIGGWTIITTYIAKAGGLLSLLTGPIGLTIIGVTAIVAVFVTQWSKIKPIIINTINYFIDLYNESMVFRAGIEAIALSFNNLWSVVKGVARIIWDTIKTLAKGIITAFGAVGDVIKGAFTGDLDLIQKGFVDFNKNVGQTAQNLAKNLGNNIKGIFNDIGDNVSNFLDKTINGNKKARITDIKVGIPGLPEATQKEVENGVNEGVSKAEKSLKGKKVNIEYDYEQTGALGVGKKEDIISGVFQNLIGDENASNAFLERVKTSFNGLIEEINSKKTDLQIAIEEMNLAISESWSRTLTQGLGDGISNLANSLGEAMANGGNFIQSIGKSLLSTIGDIAIQLGKAAISIGVGMIAIKAAFKNPFTAIAAGVALVALGAFIKGTVAKIPEGGGSGSYSGSTSSATGDSSSSYTSSSTVYQNGGFNGEVVFKINGYDLIGVISKNQDRLTRLGN